MNRVTKFASRDPGPAARVAGFMAHLRGNGLRLGVGETETALAALAQVQATNPAEARMALRAVCTGSADEARAFDAVFDAYWLNGGRVVSRMAPGGDANLSHTRSTATADGPEASGAGERHAPDGSGEGQAEGGGEGRLVATGVDSLMKKDLRDIVSREDIAEAERVAEALGRAFARPPLAPPPCRAQGRADRPAPRAAAKPCHRGRAAAPAAPHAPLTVRSRSWRSAMCRVLWWPMRGLSLPFSSA